jgi:two-component system, NtrC family, sensor histidine kinase HydH
MPAMESVFDELKRYVDWSADDEAALRELHPHSAPHFARIAELFYARILTHEGARAALVGGESRVGQLKVSLIAWMDRLLSGPWDDEYYQLRARIGRVHVRIALPQHYMFGAMNIFRRELNAIVDDEHLHDAQSLRRGHTAVNKILDLELAIMLHTYREDLIAQQARTERLATFGQLIGSIGHELRNPLGVIESSVYILDQRVGGDERAKKHIVRIGEQLGVANGIISTLLDMIRDKPLQREKVLLDATIASVLGSVSTTTRIAVDGVATLPPIDADPVQIRQVFMNLVENAVHAAGPDGDVRIEGSLDGHVVQITVDDSGPGVDPETRRRLFEPLITTKTKGIGLGLALVRRIITRHGGDVSYEPRAGRGARFVVRLPRGDQHA